MKITPLLKNADWKESSQEALQKEFGKAEKCGEIRIGENCLFYRGFFRVRFVPLEVCERMYMRVEFGEYGEFPLHEHYIVVRTRQGKELCLRMERPDDARAVMDCLRKHSCRVALGKEKKE